MGALGPAIVLIGPRRAGKTAVGRELAGLLGCPFVDLDHEIERVAGVPCAVLLGRGEAGFREVERRALARLASEQEGQRFVLATGGGTPLSPENRTVLRALGLVVWLALPAEEQIRRAESDPDPTSRPRLLGGSIESEIRQLAAVRDPIYREAADAVVASTSAPERVARVIAGQERDLRLESSR